MCVNRLSWEASDGKKREEPTSSIPDFEKSHYFSVLYEFIVLTEAKTFLLRAPLHTPPPREDHLIIKETDPNQRQP